MSEAKNKKITNKEIKNKDVIEFFNRYAATWDDDMVRNDEIINAILDNAGVGKGSTVLDVACGTGVLIPDYLKRDVISVSGVDISPEMIKIAKKKFSSEQVKFVCGDVFAEDLGGTFDSIVVYNAFPHFSDSEGLIRRLSVLLNPGGTLTIAHGAGRDTINAHHKGAASIVSVELMPAEDLAAIFAKYLNVETVISTDEMYQVTGKLAR